MSENHNWEVIVIGWGPAGAMAAYELAKAGKRVAIIEKETLPALTKREARKQLIKMGYE